MLADPKALEAGVIELHPTLYVKVQFIPNVGRAKPLCDERGGSHLGKALCCTRQSPNKLMDHESSLV